MHNPRTMRHTRPRPASDPLLFPSARLRRLALPGDVVAYLGAQWDDMEEPGRQAFVEELAVLSDAEIVERFTPQGTPSVSEGVPDGSASAVLRWVRAQQNQQGAAIAALRAENQREKPRTSLVARLERLIG